MTTGVSSLERRLQVEDVELCLSGGQTKFRCDGPPLCVHWPDGTKTQEENVAIGSIKLRSRLVGDTSTQEAEFHISSEGFFYHVDMQNDVFLCMPKRVTFDGVTAHVQGETCASQPNAQENVATGDDAQQGAGESREA